MAEETKKPTSEKKEASKKVEEKTTLPKHTKAIAAVHSAKISQKYTMAVCRMILNKTPSRAIEMLKKVIIKKQPVKMPSREVSHKKGKGISGAKYPKNVAEAMIPLVKQLESNAVHNGIENPIISLAISNRAPKVHRRAGRIGKRTHVYLEAISKPNKQGEQK
jgi:ribosomal protein L22